MVGGVEEQVVEAGRKRPNSRHAWTWVLKVLGWLMEGPGIRASVRHDVQCVGLPQRRIDLPCRCLRTQEEVPF